MPSHPVEPVAEDAADGDCGQEFGREAEGGSVSGDGAAVRAILLGRLCGFVASICWRRLLSPRFVVVAHPVPPVLRNGPTIRERRRARSVPARLTVGPAALHPLRRGWPERGRRMRIGIRAVAPLFGAALLAGSSDVGAGEVSCRGDRPPRFGADRNRAACRAGRRPRLPGLPRRARPRAPRTPRSRGPRGPGARGGQPRFRRAGGTPRAGRARRPGDPGDARGQGRDRAARPSSRDGFRRPLRRGAGGRLSDARCRAAGRRGGRTGGCRPARRPPARRAAAQHSAAAPARATANRRRRRAGRRATGLCADVRRARLPRPRRLARCRRATQPHDDLRRALSDAPDGAGGGRHDRLHLDRRPAPPGRAGVVSAARQRAAGVRRRRLRRPSLWRTHGGRRR